ncbi:glycerophosphodiester phosphodiesterase family protein [Weissella tructae]|uniref:Glycerophosphoryl diester phosphodiesterase n=2 Tax=Weissella TaxID=46255 RepID=A0A075U5C1_9LACO|nr:MULTISPECIES: glycerophosphodiester phosphodiesterase family protein [Weissella]AIM62641.1 Glycerophosphoryl diester phosphodiesterase [Weissella ceti]QVV91709.1 glycerophosphoryl diester phosphodiesterase [Weissella tructae]
MMERTIFAHRGVPAKLPENTMRGFNAVADSDVMWIETDVAITKDGQLILMHDDFLDRTTDMTGEITAKDWPEIKFADASVNAPKKLRGERIPTMEAFIPFINHHGLNINFELKGVSGPNGLALSKQLVRQMMTYLDQLDAGVKVQISSFNPILLGMMRQAYPKAQYALLFEKATFNPDWPMLAQACEVTEISIENEGLTEADVTQIRALGYEVNVWTVNSGRRIKELFDWGVKGIFTDNAPKFLKIATKYSDN